MVLSGGYIIYLHLTTKISENKCTDNWVKYPRIYDGTQENKK